MRARSARPANRFSRLAHLCVAASFWPGSTAHAGSARDYLNAPVDTWLLNYNASYTTSLTPEDGTDTIPGIRSNVFAQSVVLTRIMDYWGRTGGLSLVLPYALIDTSAGPFRASSNGMSDVGFLWQMNIFGGPALTREEFHSFVPQTFSSFHLLVTTPNWNLSAELADQSQREPMDGLADCQSQLYAGPRLELDSRPTSQGDFSPTTTTISSVARRH